MNPNLTQKYMYLISTFVQQQLLNLRLNCYVYLTRQKKSELELYQSLRKTAYENAVTIYVDLQDQQFSESTKQSSYNNSKILSPEL